VLLIQRPNLLLPCPNAGARLEQDDTLFVVGERGKLLEIASLP
jgi:K+/H+ antiporter YhaU regulatory subunit KhtT